jgi:threonine aldolase
MRKMLGGGMRQAGVLAAAGLVALEGWEGRLAADHRRAVDLARRLGTVPGVAGDPDAVATNIVLCDVSGTGLAADRLAERLLAGRIACSVASPAELRFVLHHQIGEPEIAALEAAMRTAVAA